MESILGIIFTVALTFIASGADRMLKQRKRQRLREKLRNDLDDTVPPLPRQTLAPAVPAIAPLPNPAVRVPAPPVLPVEGARVTAPEAEEKLAAYMADSEAARLRDHYDYWRRTLIASEIINRPKY